MPSRKQILKNQALWELALTSTIANYDYIKDPMARASACPLCQVTKDDRNMIQCDSCIHLSPFSQNKPCVRQTSYNAVAHVSSADTTYRIKFRQFYLQGILERMRAWK